VKAADARTGPELPAPAAAADAAEREAWCAAAAASVVASARAAGAEHAEAHVGSGRSFTVRVSGGEIESLTQSATRGLGLRVIVNGAVGSVSSNDFRPEALEDLARRAVALARFSTPDPANGLPLREETAEAAPPGDLALVDPAIAALPALVKIEMALTLERAALGFDPRVKRVEVAMVGSGESSTALANSDGLVRAWSGTGISAYVQPLADDAGGKQQSGSYHVSRRHLTELPDLEWMANEAARRAIARIGARVVPTARVPVIMHPDIAESWLDDLYGAFTAEAVIKRESWLTGKLDTVIASPLVTLVDDGRLAGGVGTSPWDGEGVPTRRNVLVERGRLAMFEYDCYWARRAGVRSTGNGMGSTSIGYHNLHLEAGSESPEAILARVERGFYMDDQGAYGFNPVTGDYSFQAQGFWIENGRKAFPVDGVTVAAHSLDMLRDIQAVGSDLKLEASVGSPTLLIAEMTVGGSA
jgi:PmbA protein